VGHTKIGFQVAAQAREFLLGGDAVFGQLALLQDALRFFLVLPEIRAADFRF
jgi:hypothetical protein